MSVSVLGEEAVDWCATIDGLDTGNQRAGGLGQYRRRRDPIQ
jgi:hypothetical protein